MIPRLSLSRDGQTAPSFPPLCARQTIDTCPSRVTQKRSRTSRTEEYHTFDDFQSAPNVCTALLLAADEKQPSAAGEITAKANTLPMESCTLNCRVAARKPASCLLNSCVLMQGG